MPERRGVRVGMLVFALAAALPAPAAETAPRGHHPALDGPPVRLTAPGENRVWAAWSWRSGGEFDIAVSVRDEDGRWSEPTLLGADDGIDQVEPALAADASGNLYLAWVDEQLGRVSLAVRARGDRAWSKPVELASASGAAAAPALLVVGQRLVVAWRTAGGIGVIDIPLLPPPPIGDRKGGIVDGPDPISFGNPPGR